MYGVASCCDLEISLINISDTRKLMQSKFIFLLLHLTDGNLQSI